MKIDIEKVTESPRISKAEYESKSMRKMFPLPKNTSKSTVPLSI